MLNLCTTLTPATALKRHTYFSHIQRTAQQPSARVDLSSPIISAALNQIVADNGGDAILVRAGPPVHVRVIASGNLLLSGTKKPLDGVAGDKREGTFDSFMSEWSTLVGDPILSKWIVLALAVSVFLNGYLLKGIGSGAGGGFGGKGHGIVPMVTFAPAVDYGADVNVSAPEQDREEPKVNGVAKPNGALSIDTGLPAAVSPAPEPISLPLAVNGHEEIVVNTPLGTPSGEKASVGRREFDEVVRIFEAEGAGALTDEEVVLLGQRGKIAPYALEKVLGDFERAVKIRRALICESLQHLILSWSETDGCVFSSCICNQDP